MREVVTYVKFHGSDAFIPGVGNVGSTLPNNTKSMDLLMHYTSGEQVIRARVNGRTLCIPLGSVQLFLTAPDTTVVDVKSSTPKKSA